MNDLEWTIDFKMFTTLSTHLGLLKNELLATANHERKENARVWLPIRVLVTELYETVPELVRQSAKRILEIQILEGFRLGKLASLDSTIRHDAVGDLSKLVEMKLGILDAATRNVERGAHGCLEIHPEIDGKVLEYHWKRRVPNQSGEAVQVLVDFKIYDDALQGQLLWHRMGQITKMRQVIDDPQSMGLLSCRGFYHDNIRSAYGLVYDVPQTCRDMVSLHEVLNNAVAAQPSRLPSLSWRFQLALNIVKPLLEVHKIGWVHKGLSSANIAFFPTADDQRYRPAWEYQPYPIGFRHTRPNETDIFTDGPVLDTHLRDYQHPGYRARNIRDHVAFDYYSLGMVLLEIGLWRPLQKIPQFKGMSAEEAREKVITSKAPLLGYFMGDVYQAAVEACLTFEVPLPEAEVVRDGHDSRNCQLNFETKVLRPLSQLATFSL